VRGFSTPEGIEGEEREVWLWGVFNFYFLIFSYRRTLFFNIYVLQVSYSYIYFCFYYILQFQGRTNRDGLYSSEVERERDGTDGDQTKGYDGTTRRREVVLVPGNGGPDV